MSTADIVFIVVVVVVVAVLVIWIAGISARAKRMSAASDARLAMELEGLAANPPAAVEPGPKPPSLENPAGPAVPSSKEVRLQELTGLHASGVISDDELAAARAKILAE
jgi:hypothetical protein